MNTQNNSINGKSNYRLATMNNIHEKNKDKKKKKNLVQRGYNETYNDLTI